ncbi:hypothetical protein UPYG_G00043590 [Umbra pygmaea]|uniref:Uncharacterized protein n=1 Tax=Umbra pygmaea TaxID=75934 RepID=A0ABD0XQJ4_UMBPY
MSNPIQQNVAERTLCIILEGIYECLWEMLDEVILQMEVHGIGTHSASRGGRPWYNIPAVQLTCRI